MTTTNTNTKNIFTCNGATTVFTYTFTLPVGAGFELIQTNTTTGVQTTISTANYSVSGIGVAAGGTVTYNPSGVPVPAGNTLTFARVTPETQQTSLINQGGYNPGVVEPAMDWIVAQIQDLNERVNRCIQLPIVESTTANPLPIAALRVNKTLTFDGSGNPQVS